MQGQNLHTRHYNKSVRTGLHSEFLENLNYIEKLRMEGKVENCPLALQQQKCVSLCNIVSPLTFPSLCLCILK